MNSVFQWANRSLAALPRWLVVGGALGITLGLVAIDVLSEPFISLVLFYTLAIGICAWYASQRWALLCGVITAFGWLGDLGSATTPPLLAIWNALIRVCALFIFLHLLVLLRDTLRQATYLASHDPLTNALNVRAFRERLAAVQQQGRQAGRPLTLAYLDLDNFKAINDRHGHSTGDRLLTELVSAIRPRLGPEGAIARMGGDEFVLILPGVDAAAAQLECARLVERAEATFRKHAWPVTLSMGVATFLGSPDTADDMLRAADALMYGVKRGGKASVRYATFSASAAPDRPDRDSARAVSA